MGRLDSLRAALVLGALVILSWTSAARAGENEAKPYSEQVVLADVASIGVMAGGAGISAAAGSRSDAYDAGIKVAVAGAFGWFLAAPIVHFAHHRPGVGVLDLAMRLTIPLGLYALVDKRSDASIPLVLGSAGAISALDATVFARPSDEHVTPYREGAVVDADARVESRPRWLLVGVGLGTWMLAYSPMVGTIPVVAPWVATAKLIADPDKLACPKDGPLSCPMFSVVAGIGVGMLVTDALLQTGGVALAAIGFLHPEKVVVKPSATAVTVRPVFSPSNVGVAGTF